MHGRARFAIQAAFFRVGRPQSLLGTEPPNAPLGRGNAQSGQLVGNESVTIAGVLSVHVTGSIREMCV